MKKVLFILCLTFIVGKIQAQCPNPVFINAGVNNLASNHGPTVSNECWILNTSFIVDDDIVFNNCTLYVNTSLLNFLYIFVNISKKLSLINTYIYSNSSTWMWGGIILYNNSEIRVVDSYIEDAEYAIIGDISASPVINVTNSTFNRNYKHIVYQASAVSSVNIQESNFLCRDDNGTPGLVLKSPHLGQRTAEGIAILGGYNINVFANIGTPNNGNYIENTDIGINNGNSTVSAIENTIVNPPNLKGSIGIYAHYNDRLIAKDNKISGFGEGIKITESTHYFEVDRNEIFDVDEGISHHDNYQSSSMIGYMRENLIYEGTNVSLKIGIINNNNKGAFHIKNNIITNAFEYYIISQNNGNSVTNIYDNELYNYNNYPSTGIYISEPNHFTSTSYTISENFILDPVVGINAINLYKPNLYNNYVRVIAIPPDPFALGIVTENCQSPAIIGNDVAGTSSMVLNDALSTIGYKVSNCNESNIQCNKVDNIRHGFWFSGNNRRPRFIENKMYDCKYQFYLYHCYNGLGNIGSSTFTADNRWFTQTASGSKNTFSDNSNDLSIPGHTTFHVIPSATYLPVIDPFNDYAPIGYSACQAQTYNVFRNPICGGDPPGIAGNGDDELRVATADWTGYEEEEWMAKSAVYANVKNDTSGTVYDPLVLNMVDSLEFTNISLTKELNDAISALPFDSTQAQVAPDILTVNNALIPANIIESNIKNLNEIYLTTIAVNIPVSVNQREFIEQLANDCPYTAGPAVYTARVLLNIIEPTVRYYSTTCDFNQQQQKIQKNLNKLENIIFYPNPSMDKIIFNLKNPTDYNLIIKDYLGIIHYQDKLVSNEVNLSKLSNGVYTVILSEEGDIILNNKLIKIN